MRPILLLPILLISSATAAVAQEATPFAAYQILRAWAANDCVMPLGEGPAGPESLGLDPLLARGVVERLAAADPSGEVVVLSPDGATATLYPGGCEMLRSEEVADEAAFRLMDEVIRAAGCEVIDIGGWVDLPQDVRGSVIASFVTSGAVIVTAEEALVVAPGRCEPDPVAKVPDELRASIVAALATAEGDDCSVDFSFYEGHSILGALDLPLPELLRTLRSLATSGEVLISEGWENVALPAEACAAAVASRDAREEEAAAAREGAIVERLAYNWCSSPTNDVFGHFESLGYGISDYEAAFFTLSERGSLWTERNPEGPGNRIIRLAEPLCFGDADGGPEAAETVRGFLAAQEGCAMDYADLQKAVAKAGLEQRHLDYAMNRLYFMEGAAFDGTFLSLAPEACGTLRDG